MESLSSRTEPWWAFSSQESALGVRAWSTFLAGVPRKRASSVFPAERLCSRRRRIGAPSGVCWRWRQARLDRSKVQRERTAPLRRLSYDTLKARRYGWDSWCVLCQIASLSPSFILRASLCPDVCESKFMLHECAWICTTSIPGHFSHRRECMSEWVGAPFAQALPVVGELTSTLMR